MSNYRNYFNSFQINENKIPKNKNNQTYQYYNMMNLNYINEGNIINNNINKINSDVLGDNSLMIDIPQLLLTKIEKKYLIDLILFIRNFCNLKISNKYLDFKHDIYEIKIYNNKQCTINIKDSEKRKLKIIGKEEEDIKEENINKSENIFNEERNNENEIKDKKNNLKNEKLINSSSEEYSDNIIIISSKNMYFHCINHNKSFQSKKELMKHCKSVHKFRCGECGLFFGKQRKLNNHLRLCKKKRINRK